MDNLSILLQMIPREDSFWELFVNYNLEEHIHKRSKIKLMQQGGESDIDETWCYDILDVFKIKKDG